LETWPTEISNANSYSHRPGFTQTKMSSGLLSKLWDKVNPHFVLKLKGGSFRPAKISDDGIELRLLDGLYRMYVQLSPIEVPD
jgi:hypothetical protein